MVKCREVSFKVLCMVFINSAYSNLALNSELKNNELNDADRALTTEIVYGTIKYKYTVDHILDSFLKKGIKSLNVETLIILEMSMYQIIKLTKVPDFAVVNEANEIAKKHCSLYEVKLINGVLRNFLRNKNRLNSERLNHIQKLCVEYSFKPEMVKFFLKQYGESRLIEILKGSNLIPAVTIRANRLKTDRKELKSILSELGYTLEDGVISKEALYVKKGRGIEKCSYFKDGFFSIQDESAMIPVMALDIESCNNTEDLEIFDMCSAPGGKTAYMAEILKNKGRITAFDIHKNKMSLIESNIERLGIKNVSAKVMDSSKYNDSLKDKADLALLDVPCTGLGIIRKKPEIKWVKNLSNVDELVTIQRNILLNSSKYLKKGGCMVYSTCTLDKKENEENIYWFLENNKNFKIEPIYIGSRRNILYENGLVTVLPDEQLDGFFIAKLRKI